MRARLLPVLAALLLSMSQAGFADAVASATSDAAQPVRAASAPATQPAPAKVTAIPEPHTWLLILSGLAVGGYLVRRLHGA